ncbi:ABC transporter ATP-binding protein [Pandoraea terrae]|uniref:ABC transporter ATP-binding protein n=1 Tax=Pandoraea terrae TaxID=1537710 RepID=A0A5E4T133_9BURK|nr:ABC transporter ATP-binding protein [Pandoraea terrae]VVD81495.1 ABC transporter ATP-binding protein [Pandoraea terrae]
MNLLELAGVTKRFGAFVALDEVDWHVAAGEVHCLLGENGAGKSTLCNLVFGVYQPDAGAMRFDGAPHAPAGPIDALARGIAMVHQHFSLVGNMTVAENLVLGRARAVLRYDDVLEKMARLADEYDLAIDPHRVISELSVGERQRVEIIKCLLTDPRLLVLDEPTAVLPPGEVDALLTVCRKVAASGRAVILVTHKLAEIAKVADRTTVLRRGRIVESVPMAGADMQMLVRSMVGRDVSTADSVLAATLGIASQAAATVTADMADTTATEGQACKAAAMEDAVEALTLDALTFRDADGVLRLDDVTLAVRRGEIVGVAGVEGNGQTELGAILAGLATPTQGQICIGGRDVTGARPGDITAAGAGIVPEDRHAVACIGELSISENLFLGATHRYSRWGLLDRARMARDARALMQAFDVRADSPDVPMGRLSGGNQQKAVLARELTREPLTFLLAAQPTRGLDVGAVEAVFRRICSARDAGLGVLLISSDLNELIAVSDRVVVLYRGRVVGEMPATPGNRETIGAMMSGHGHG